MNRASKILQLSLNKRDETTKETKHDIDLPNRFRKRKRDPDYVYDEQTSQHRTSSAGRHVSTTLVTSSISPHAKVRKWLFHTGTVCSNYYLTEIGSVEYRRYWRNIIIIGLDSRSVEGLGKSRMPGRNMSKMLITK